MLIHLQKHLNTSHVKVNLLTIIWTHMQTLYLNTSHVKVNLAYLAFISLVILI